MHDSDSAPSCCAFTHWLAFEEVSGPRVLFKSGQGNLGLSACGTTHGASLKFPSEAGFILRSLRSPAEGEGNEGFPPPPDKDLESPSSTRLEAQPLERKEIPISRYNLGQLHT